MIPEYVVTGAPRSGTKAISVALTQAGFDCGHEEFYGLTIAEPTHRGDASWLALPRVEDGQLRPELVLGQVRDPLDVISSLVHHLPRDPAYMRFAQKYGIRRNRRVSIEDWCAQWTMEWMTRTLDRCQAWWRIEDGMGAAAQIVGRYLGEEPDDVCEPTEPINHRGTIEPVRPHHLSPHLAKHVTRLARAMDYI